MMKFRQKVAFLDLVKVYQKNITKIEKHDL